MGVSLCEALLYNPLFKKPTFPEKTVLEKVSDTRGYLRSRHIRTEVPRSEENAHLLGPPQGPRYGHTVGCVEEAFSYGRGTPVAHRVLGMWLCTGVPSV